MHWVFVGASWFGLTAFIAVISMYVVVIVQHVRFARYHRYKNDALVPLSVLGALRLWTGEVWAWCVLAWWRTIGLGRDGWWTPSEGSGPAVICVHGFTQDGTNWIGLRRRLYRQGRASRAMYLGRPLQPLAGYVPKLERVLEEALAKADEVDVVCHSMGGIILRMVLVRRPEWADRLRNIVTLGSPHAGTASPRGFAFAADMRGLGRRSEVLATLPVLTDLAPNASVTSVYTRRDFIVYPASSSHIPGATNHMLTGIGHGGLLVFDEVLAMTIEAVSADRAQSEEKSA